MNAKALIVFLVFLIWVHVSWRWYTAGIKGFHDGSVDLVDSSFDDKSEPLTTSPSEDSRVWYKDDCAIIFFPYKDVSEDFYDDISTYLDDIARYIIEAEKQFFITGHTDIKGSESYNLRLGLQRAQLIADGLIHRGVSANLLTVRSQGENQPLIEGKEADQQRNRRVEIRPLK
ncbi:MAG: OmpA family protein [Flavobacteriales bacterium]|nr:OmpA family protein [Flavobacteriales bacterium]